MMEKTCTELFEGFDCTIVGDPSAPVDGLAYRSDLVQPRDMFFCIVGLTADGHTFAQDAVDRGAKVLVCEHEPDLANAADVTQVIVANSRRAMAYASAQFYDNPSRDFQLVGVTGTNGKTTTTYLVEHIARVAGKKTGIVGTVGIKIGDESVQSLHTTPESPDLQQAFAEARDAGCDVVAMEVSSHALDLSRTWATSFAVTAFTNLTQDHLDYHQTFDAYFDAKALLFSRDYPARRVICINDEYGRELARRCISAGDDVITVGYEDDAFIHPISMSYSVAQTDVVLDISDVRYDFSYPLVGQFNVENVMCAFGIGLQLGIPAQTIVKALRDCPEVPGRLQCVTESMSDTAGDVAVYVDYAHTPDALVKALDAIKTGATGRVFVVFGCGGDRDATKRPIMGRAALAADYAIVTSDNPRNEDPQAIIDDIVVGMGDATDRFEIIEDRKSAIARAIELAEEGDSILIAGKGHENYQIVGNETREFDDARVAADELARRALRSKGGEQ